MRSLDHYLGKISRGADNAFTDPRESLPPIPESAFEAVKPRSNMYLRARAIFGLARRTMPESVWQKLGAGDFFWDVNQLPVNFKKYSLKHRLGSGNQCDAFLLEPNAKSHDEASSLVMKVFQNGSKTLEQIHEKAVQVKNDYETLKDWYKDMPGLIPNQAEVILPRFQRPHGEPSLVIFQDFLGKGIQDVAHDFSAEHWTKTCAQFPQLNSQLRQFVNITERNIVEKDLVPDLLGRDNLAAAYDKGSVKLVFLDPDGIDHISHMDDKTKKRVLDRLSLLRSRADVAGPKKPD